MYRSYSLAALCYAYLHDVPEEYAFDGSQWHWRGWTLQEFIAPRIVVFLSASLDGAGHQGRLPRGATHEMHEGARGRASM